MCHEVRTAGADHASIGHGGTGSQLHAAIDHATGHVADAAGFRGTQRRDATCDQAAVHQVGDRAVLHPDAVAGRRDRRGLEQAGRADPVAGAWRRRCHRDATGNHAAIDQVSDRTVLHQDAVAGIGTDCSGIYRIDQIQRRLWRRFRNGHDATRRNSGIFRKDVSEENCCCVRIAIA